jgi:hypothetical protein
MDLTKQIKASFFLFLTVLPLLFFLFLFSHQKFIRWQMKEKLEQEHLVSITLSESDFQWHEKDKEIIYNEHYFDVKSIIKLPDHKLLITGLYDYQEQKLHESIARMHDKKSDKTTHKLIQQLLAFIATEPVYNRIDCFSLQSILSSFDFYDPSLRYCYLPIIIPPPKVV